MHGAPNLVVQCHLEVSRDKSALYETALCFYRAEGAGEVGSPCCGTRCALWARQDGAGDAPGRHRFLLEPPVTACCPFRARRSRVTRPVPGAARCRCRPAGAAAVSPLCAFPARRLPRCSRPIGGQRHPPRGPPGAEAPFAPSRGRSALSATPPGRFVRFRARSALSEEAGGALGRSRRPPRVRRFP